MVEKDISNESQVYGLGGQVNNGIIYQARKYRLNCLLEERFSMCLDIKVLLEYLEW